MRKTFKLEGLDCANCAAKMERAVAKLPNVTGVTVNFMAMRMVLEAPDEVFDARLTEAKKLAKKIEPDIEIL